MDALLKHTKDLLINTNHKSIWLGVSGGVDSMVLLHLCKTLYDIGDIKHFNVVYINHQLHPDAAVWGEFVKRTTYHYNFAYHAISVDCRKDIGVEESARDARYNAIFSLMQTEDILLTAHHHDDQKETILFRLLRGSSPKGLLGMHRIKTIMGYTICRPLLNCKKSLIIAYANKHNIEYINDSTNASMAFTRNRIRKALQLINVQEGINTSRMHLVRQLNIIDELLLPMMQSACISPHILCLDQLSEHSIDIQNEIFYRFLFKNLGDVSHTQAFSLFEMLRSAKKDKYPIGRINGKSVMRYRNIITVLELPVVYQTITSDLITIDLALSGYIINTNGIKITVEPLIEKGKYKKLLQQKGIPSWLRGYIPMVNGKIIFDYENIKWVPPKTWLHWISA